RLGSGDKTGCSRTEASLFHYAGSHGRYEAHGANFDLPVPFRREHLSGGSIPRANRKTLQKSPPVRNPVKPEVERHVDQYALPHVVQAGEPCVPLAQAELDCSDILVEQI